MPLDQLVSVETPPLFWLDGFEGMNVRDDRKSIGEQQCYWMENFFPEGKGHLHSMDDNGTPIFTAGSPGTIVYDFPFNIGSTFYHALFFSDGSAKAVNVVTKVATSIGGPGTFTVSPTPPACAQWGASGIVIITTATNGYFAWDGVLYSPGGAAPAWLSGLAAPLTPTGTTNSNTSVTAVSSTTGVANGMWITGSTGDIPANTYVQSFTVNSITLTQAATGSHVGETLTIQWQMPLGISGTAAEIFQNRVWIINGAQFSFSAPSNGADFNTADGAGTVKSTDGFLRTKFLNLKQSNSFLYTFGDGSINVISNVQTSGSPATTTFNNQNVDPQTGLGWRDALVPFGRALCFANPTGVYALFGGAAEKISDMIDDLFSNADFTTVTPSLFVTTLHGKRCLGLVINTLDLTTNVQRTIMALWTGEKWFVGSQGLTTIFGTTMEVNAEPQGWGNDGTNVYQLFETASNTLQKKIVTKLWAGKSPLIIKTAHDIYSETTDFSGQGVILSGTIDSDVNPSVAFNINANINFVNQNGQVINFVNQFNQAIQFVTGAPGIQGTTAENAGMRLGLTITSTSSDFHLNACGLTYNEERFFGR